MKKIISLSYFILFFVFTAFSQNQFTPNSGDPELDKDLKEINATAKKDINLFKRNMADQFKVKQEKITDLLDLKKMEPADVFMALKIAKIIDIDIDIVIGKYEENKGKGWGAIAKQMGIKPGSPEFHELKNSSKGNKGAKSKGKSKGNGKEKKDGKNNGKKK